jgi:hypothetical protein
MLSCGKLQRIESATTLFLVRELRTFSTPPQAPHGGGDIVIEMVREDTRSAHQPGF